MTLIEAVANVIAETDALSDPAIPTDRVTTIVQSRLRVVAFAPSTFYRLGQLVTSGDPEQPGPLYLCRAAGQSGTGVPNWPLSGGVSIVSGNASFALAGAHDGDPYDLIAAFRAVTREKLAVAAKRIDVAAGNEKASLSQQAENLRAQLASYGPEWPC